MADVYVNALTTISTEPTSTDSVVCVNRNTNEGQIIDYNLLADVILSKISSKTFSSLTTTSKLLTGAINELDADVTSLNSSVGLLRNQNTGISENPTASEAVASIIQREIAALASSAYGVYNNSRSWPNHGNGYTIVITKYPYVGGSGSRYTGLFFDYSNGVYLFIGSGESLKVSSIISFS